MALIVGTPVVIKVTFRGFVNGQNEIVDPVTVVFTLLDSSENAIITDNPVRLDYGIYSYTWTPGITGSFISKFTGTFFDGSQDVVVSEFEVETATQAAQNAAVESINSLEADQYLSFFVTPTPFYIDPEIIRQYFPQASLSEIASLVYDASKEAQDIFVDSNGHSTLRGDNAAQVFSPTIQTTVDDFVIAQVCCYLTRIYDMGNGANEFDVTLGDLTVNQRNQVKTGGVNRSNATTWCELAGVIRTELYALSNKSGMRAILKGSKYHNPIPRRGIQTQEWRSWGWDRDYNWRRDNVNR